jgi:hypothetical protein
MLRLPLVLATTALAVSAAACGGSSSTVATPASTPRSTPALASATAAPERSGDAGFHALARTFDAAVRHGDVDFIRDRMRTAPEDCTGPYINTPGGATCDYRGQRYDGFPVSHWRSEGGIAPASGVTDQFTSVFANGLAEDHDEFGTGAPSVYALNVDPTNYAAVVTALIKRPPNFAGAGPLRISIVTTWQYGDRRWEMTGVMYAYVLAEEFLQPDAYVATKWYARWERLAAD